MCGAEYMFAAQAAASLGGAVIGAVDDQNQYAKAIRQRNKKIKAINEEASAIDKSTIFKYQLSNLQQQQIQDQTAAKVGDSRLKLAEAVGTGTAAAATGGVEGNSVQALLNSFAVSTGRDIMFTNQQGDNEVAQSQAEQKGFELDATSRKTALRNQIPDYPDDPTAKILSRFMTSAFQIGGAYFNSTTPVMGTDGKVSRKFG